MYDKRGGMASNKKIIGIILLLLSSMQLAVAQQMPQYAQYMFNPLAINPAVAGGEEVLSLGFINRDQWSGVENAPKTQTLMAHSSFVNQNLGLGLVLTHDKIGVHKNLFASVAPAYHLKTGKQSTLSFGAQLNVIHQRSDYPSLMQNGTVDPNLAQAVNSLYADFGFGFFFRSKNFQLGLSAPSFLSHRENPSDTASFEVDNAHYFVFSRYTITMNPYWKVQPGFLIRYTPDLQTAFDVNANIIYRNVLTLGASYRSEKSLTTLLMAQASKQLQLGYAYDFALGDVALPRTGSHELMLKYIFRYNTNNISSPR